MKLFLSFLIINEWLEETWTGRQTKLTITSQWNPDADTNADHSLRDDNRISTYYRMSRRHCSAPFLDSLVCGQKCSTPCTVTVYDLVTTAKWMWSLNISPTLHHVYLTRISQRFCIFRLEVMHGMSMIFMFTTWSAWGTFLDFYSLYSKTSWLHLWKQKADEEIHDLIAVGRTYCVTLSVIFLHPNSIIVSALHIF